MGQFKRGFAIVATILFAGFFAQASHSHSEQARVRGPEWLNQLKLQGRVEAFTGVAANAHQPFSTLINSARQSILMEMYHMTDTKVINDLAAAGKHGVDITLIMDAKSVAGQNYVSVQNTLETGGVSIIPSSKAFSITHTKSVVVDDQTAIVSSMNLTASPETRRDYGVVIEDPGVIAEMENVFKADVQNAKDQTGNTPELSDPHLLWSPVNSEQKLHELIQSAQTSIVAVAENVLDANLINELVAAAKRGVKVRVMSPACPLGGTGDGNYNATMTIINGGGDARQMPDPATPTTPYLHGKMMVVDGKMAYVGSINYSHNSMALARELGIVVNDSAAVTAFLNSFNTDYAHANKPGKVAPACKVVQSN